MISIISQEPVLFSGYYTYLFEEYSDVKLWDALDKIKLKLVIIELPGGLHSIYVYI